MVRLGNKGRFGSIYGGGKRVLQLDFANVDSPYPYLLFISQAETERILREGCTRHGVEVEWNVALAGIQQDALSHDPFPVHAVLRHKDGRIEAVAAPWLIGTEGAHSLIRTTLDLPFEGQTREEAYALADIRIDGALADTDFHIFSSAHGFMGLFPIGGDHFRLIASNPLSKPEKDTAPAVDEIQKIYDMRSHIPARFHDLVWSSWFRINSRMVSRLKIGRFFIGGDAAHIHSPAGAQGMNTGIQDMVNLCWKLAAVIKGQAPAALLDTYADDRLPIMRHVLANTDSLTDMIGSENSAVRAIFNNVAPYLGNAAFMQRNQTAGMAQIALDYRSSPLSDRHYTGGTLHSGDRVPDMPVRSQVGGQWSDARLLQLLDPSRFTLVVNATEDAVLPDGLQAAASGEAFARVAPATGQDGSRVADHVLGRDSVTLVRPDGYAGLTSALAAAKVRLDAYRQKWLTPRLSPASDSRPDRGR